VSSLPKTLNLRSMAPDEANPQRLTRQGKLVRGVLSRFRRLGRRRQGPAQKNVGKGATVEVLLKEGKVIPPEKKMVEIKRVPREEGDLYVRAGEFATKASRGFMKKGTCFFTNACSRTHKDVGGRKESPSLKGSIRLESEPGDSMEFFPRKGRVAQVASSEGEGVA